jgi:hypothetical protein
MADNQRESQREPKNPSTWFSGRWVGPVTLGIVTVLIVVFVLSHQLATVPFSSARRPNSLSLIFSKR